MKHGKGQESAPVESKDWRQVCFEAAQVVCTALVAVVILFTFVCRLVDVKGSSMETTLLNGDRLLLSNLPYTPAYGDIVVVDRGETQEPLIKRVIGLPGDTLSIDGQTGAVYRNGVLLQEPYVTDPTALEQMDGTVLVPEGTVFVMGDNRASGHSLDSRTFGCVAQERVVGKVVYRLFPSDRMGGLYGNDKSGV